MSEQSIKRNMPTECHSLFGQFRTMQDDKPEFDEGFQTVLAVFEQWVTTRSE